MVLRFGIASLNNSPRLWAIGMVSSCWVRVLDDLGQGTYSPGVSELDKKMPKAINSGLVGLHMKGLFIGKLLTIFRN